MLMCCVTSERFPHSGTALSALSALFALFLPGISENIEPGVKDNGLHDFF